MSSVYFIVSPATRTVKIGVAIDTRRRLRELQTGNADQLELRAVIAGDRSVEASLHARFRKYYVRGEWFAFTGDLAEFVARLDDLPGIIKEKFEMPVDREAIGLIHPDTVRDAVTRSKISKAEIARRAQIHSNSLANVESQDWNPRWKTLEAIVAAIFAIRADLT